MFNQLSDTIFLLKESIFNPQLRYLKYYIYTGFIAFLIFALLVLIGTNYFLLIGSFIFEYLPFALPYGEKVVPFLGAGVTFVFLLLIFKYLLLVFLSPLLGLLSEKVEKDMNQDLHGPSFSMVNMLLSSFRLSIINLFKEIGITILLLILGVFPLFTMVASILLIMTQSYFLGYGVMTYFTERHISYARTRSFVREHRWSVMSIGLIFYLMMLIPVVGIMIAPCFTTIIATRYGANILCAERNADVLF